MSYSVLHKYIVLKYYNNQFSTKMHTFKLADGGWRSIDLQKREIQ